MVFKCRFYYCSGIRKPIEQTMTARRQACRVMPSHVGKHRVWSKRKAVQGDTAWAGDFIIVLIGKTRQELGVSNLAETG